MNRNIATLSINDMVYYYKSLDELREDAFSIGHNAIVILNMNTNDVIRSPFNFTDVLMKYEELSYPEPLWSRIYWEDEKYFIFRTHELMCKALEEKWYYSKLQYAHACVRPNGEIIKLRYDIMNVFDSALPHMQIC